MLLDNEEQRKLLLQIANSVNINGNFIQAKNTVILIDKLIEDINKAKISKQ